MVTFELVEENENYLIYWYFPNGNKNSGYGIIILDKITNTIKIEKMAPDDFSRIVTIEEQNELRESINRMRKEEGVPLLTEEECPSATSEFTDTFFADHAISKIMKSYNSGKILRKGQAAWY